MTCNAPINVPFKQKVEMCVFKADVTTQDDTTLLKCVCLNTLKI